MAMDRNPKKLSAVQVPAHYTIVECFIPLRQGDSASKRTEREPLRAQNLSAGCTHCRVPFPCIILQLLGRHAWPKQAHGRPCCLNMPVSDMPGRRSTFRNLGRREQRPCLIGGGSAARVPRHQGWSSAAAAVVSEQRNCTNSSARGFRDSPKLRVRQAQAPAASTSLSLGLGSLAPTLGCRGLMRHVTAISLQCLASRSSSLGSFASSLRPSQSSEDSREPSCLVPLGYTVYTIEYNGYMQCNSL